MDLSHTLGFIPVFSLRRRAALCLCLRLNTMDLMDTQASVTVCKLQWDGHLCPSQSLMGRLVMRVIYNDTMWTWRQCCIWSTLMVLPEYSHSITLQMTTFWYKLIDMGSLNAFTVWTLTIRYAHIYIHIYIVFIFSFLKLKTYYVFLI